MSPQPQLRKFVAPELVFGVGARRLAGQYARNFGARKVLVVSDPGVMAAGWAEDVLESLRDVGLEHCLFSEVSPNPRAEEVMSGVELYRRKNCNIIVAVGGGSPMDCAKGIGVVSSNDRHILEFEGVDQVNTPGPPLICVPTTSGSSADVSQFAIILDSARLTKIAIVSKAVVPDVSLVDPETITTMPAYLTACTAMDALTHAIEAFVSNVHSPLTDIHALEAIRLISANLLPALASPGDLTFREQLMLGSLEAGLAFSNAILGAVHAMAHSLGGFLDLAHGECNAILLGHVVRFNFEAVPERYSAIGTQMGLQLGGLTDPQRRDCLLEQIGRLRESAGISRSLSALGMRREDIPELARLAMQDACMITNPRWPQLRDIEVLYEEAL